MIHAMKFYAASSSWRSAAQAGQDVADELIAIGDPEAARQLIEVHVLPVARRFLFADLLGPIRPQYAVILAYCGDLNAARGEMAALEAYDALPEQLLERRIAAHPDRT